MKKSVDFFQGMNSDAVMSAKKMRDPKQMGFFILLGVMFVALAAVTGVMFFQNNALEGQCKELEAYTKNPVILQKYDELTALQAESAQLASFVALGEAASAYGDGEIVFDKDMYDRMLLQKPDRVTLTNLMYTTNGITLNCTTTDNMPPADFAQNLDTSGLFNQVKYSGFSASAEGTVVFQIVCE